MRVVLSALLLALAGVGPAEAAFTDSASRPLGGATAAEVFAPRAAAAPAISGEAEENQILTASTGTWERQPERYTVRWQRCAGGVCEPVANATELTYRASGSDVGRRLRVEVTATNAGGSAVAVSVPTGVVVEPRPVNTAPPAVQGTAMRGEVLSATPGAWTGAGGLAYEWRRCPATGDGPCEAISGATTARHDLGAADVGHRLRIAVRATNGGGTVTAVSPPTDVVLERTPARAYLHAVRRDGPAALYDFELGDGRDSSGHGRDAAPRGASFGHAGALGSGSAMRLDGSGAYLDLRWSPTCGASGFTYEGWVWWESGRGYERIFDFGDHGGGSLLTLTPRFAAANQMWGIVWVGGSVFDLSGAPPLPRWTWKHVALTFAGDRRMTVYVDGVPQSTAVTPWRPADVGCRPNNWIGRSLFPADPYFGGLHDDIAIYGKALTAAQIQAHHAARLG